MYPIIKLSKREYDFLQGGIPPAKVNLWKAFAHDYTIPPNSMIVLAVEGANHVVLPVGYAAFEKTDYLTIDDAWSQYAEGNCYKSKSEFIGAIRKYPHVYKTKKVFCTVLREVVISSEQTSLPGEPLRFSSPSVSALFAQSTFPYSLVEADKHESSKDDDPFVLLDENQTKKKVDTESVVREGQDDFRRSLFVAYSGKCCITGESTKEVLQAAHIQSYIDKRSHHVQNGLLLRADFHLLYDSGLMTVLEDYTIRISHKIESKYYQSFNGKKINLPIKKSWHPSKHALKNKAKEFNCDRSI